jgi:hypothetical protein
MKKFVHTSAIKSLVLLFSICFSALTTSNASHIVGGEITYHWVSGNTYDIKLTFYRDCAGIPAPTTINMDIKSMTCATTGQVILYPQGGGVQVSPICAASILNSSCNFGTLYAVEQYTYVGTTTLPFSCNDWEFSYSECCRNAAITNIPNADSYGTYFSAMLNNLDVPFNNSVQFSDLPVNIIYNNATTSLGWSTFDVDGDSLIYEMVSARDYDTQTLTVFNLSYGSTTYLQPFYGSSNTVLDYATGILTVSPNTTQISVVCMKISEYRNGNYIGAVYRDYQIGVINGSNAIPTLTGINGTSNYITSACPGDSLTFDVLSDDADFTQTLSLVGTVAGTAASFTSTTAQHPVGTFTWVPTLADVSNSAYTFTVEVRDDYCDYYGTQTSAYRVFINGCNTNDVWPGDANADGAANLYDLLPVGIAFNDNGPVRPAASLAWVAQTCTDWTNAFMSGINHKHADTDGNGVINLDDTLAIFQNYGLTHPLRVIPAGVASIADLTVTASSDTIGLSSIVNFDISLASPVDSLYGLAFRLYFDPALIDLTATSVSFPGSMFGVNGVDMLSLGHSQGLNGFVDVALTRLNQANITGMGAVARVTIVTTDNVSGKIMLNVMPFDVVGITANESNMNFNISGDGVVIDPAFVGLNETADYSFSLYPSPAHDNVLLNYSGAGALSNLLVTDIAGKTVLTIDKPSSHEVIDIRNLEKGIYLFKVNSTNGTLVKKILIQ